MSRRASAFASASEAALRLPEAFEELYTANAMAAMTTMIRTSKTPFMASSVPTGNGAIRCAN
jgi:hypothetical protein